MQSHYDVDDYLQENKAGDCPVRSRGRKRKRARKGKKVAETDD